MTETNSPKRLRLYLIRHGEVEQAAHGKLLGRTDVLLSVRGVEQSRQLAENLATARLSAVYSSDLRRARVTAEVIAQRHNLLVQENSSWREIDMGEWEGRTVAALHEESPVMIAQLFNDPTSFEYPGGESFAAFITRIKKSLGDLLTNHESGDIALVAHGGVCRTILGSVLGMPAPFWLRLAQDNCCLNVIDWYGTNPELRLLNGGLG
jgi:broad specificity phosphatase PhoE